MSHAAQLPRSSKPDAIEYAVYDSSQPEMLKSKLEDAYNHVLKQSFEEIGSPIEDKEIFLSLSRVGAVNPDAATHLVMAYKNGTPVGASVALSYGERKTGFWIYDAVAPDVRGNGVATTMHKELEGAIRSRMGGEKYRMFVEFTHPDKNVLYKKFEDLGYRPLEMEYRDALGAKDWYLCVADVLPSGVKHTPQSVDKQELLALLAKNIAVAQIAQLAKDTQKANSEREELMTFYTDTLALIPGNTVAVSSHPCYLQDILDGKKQPRQWEGSCPDGL